MAWSLERAEVEHHSAGGGGGIPIATRIRLEPWCSVESGTPVVLRYGGVSLTGTPGSAAAPDGFATGKPPALSHAVALTSLSPNCGRAGVGPTELRGHEGPKRLEQLDQVTPLFRRGGAALPFKDRGIAWHRDEDSGTLDNRCYS